MLLSSMMARKRKSKRRSDSRLSRGADNPQYSKTLASDMEVSTSLPRENRSGHTGVSTDPPVIVDEAFEAWTLCWRINLLFYAPITKRLQCVSCSQETSYPVGSQRSLFWSRATRCTAGHGQSIGTEISADEIRPGVCSSCDQNYMLEVVKGSITCRKEGCRRVVRINRSVVSEKVESDGGPELRMDSFDKLLNKWKRYECEICQGEIEYTGNPVTALKPPSPECDHDRKVCPVCLGEMLERAIRGGRLEDIICPDLECKKPIPLVTVRENVSTEIFRIYNRKLNQKSFSQNPNFRWCKCGHGQLHSAGEQNPEFICLKCSETQCFICRKPECEHLRDLAAQRHRTKEQQRLAAKALLAQPGRAREAQQENIRSEQEKARASKRCPKASCAVPIIRESGCAHMTCKSCRTQFCWACKVIWPHGGKLHLVGCAVGTVTQVSRAQLNTAGYATGWDKDIGYDKSQDADLTLPSWQV